MEGGWSGWTPLTRLDLTMAAAGIGQAVPPPRVFPPQLPPPAQQPTGLPAPFVSQLAAVVLARQLQQQQQQQVCAPQLTATARGSVATHVPSQLAPVPTLVVMPPPPPAAAAVAAAGMPGMPNGPPLQPAATVPGATVPAHVEGGGAQPTASGPRVHQCYRLTLLTLWMMSMLRLHGHRVVLMDALYGLDVYNYQLLVLMIVDHRGCGVPVAFGVIASHEGKEDVAGLLHTGRGGADRSTFGAVPDRQGHR